MEKHIYISLSKGVDPAGRLKGPPPVRYGPAFGPYVSVIFDAGQSRMKLLRDNGKFDVLYVISMLGNGAIYYDKLWWMFMATHTEKPDGLVVFDGEKAKD